MGTGTRVGWATKLLNFHMFLHVHMNKLTSYLMIKHVADMVKQNITKFWIVSNYTVVVVISLDFFYVITNLEELWITFG